MSVSSAPSPIACSRDIWNNGVTVLRTNGDATSAEMEQFVQLVASQSQQPVDWGIMGGRDLVKTTGDVSKVISAIQNLLPSLHQTIQGRGVRNFSYSIVNQPLSQALEGLRV